MAWGLQDSLVGRGPAETHGHARGLPLLAQPCATGNGLCLAVLWHPNWRWGPIGQRNKRKRDEERKDSSWMKNALNFCNFG